MQPLLLLFLATFAVAAVRGDDEIKNLPGVNFDINFKHYSGYLKVSKTHFLHYWFAESQNDPANDPLIFWYNGGPGCSSLIGLLTEMGPYEVDDDGKTLHENPNAWNKFASVVYIESPAGVGYSYSSDGNVTTDDDQTARENYEGVKQFFKRHPNFRNHSTFLTGESYGGIYLPMLATQIIDGQKQFPINFGGMAIGNGLLNDELNEETKVRFAYYHALISEASWAEAKETCCKGCMDNCKLSDCDAIPHFGEGINFYNIYDICDPTSTQNSKKFYFIQEKLKPKKYYKTFLNRTKTNGKPCDEDDQLTAYMNQAKVRSALHIPKNLPEWDECGGVFYSRQYDDTTEFFRKILKAKVPILLYFGDVDMVCNFLGGSEFVARLGLELKNKNVAWTIDGHTPAGFKSVYEGLTYITIRGAGHMAPGWKAPQTFYAIKQFISNQPI